MKAFFYVVAIVSTILVGIVAVFNQDWCSVLRYGVGIVSIAIVIKILKHRDDFLHDIKLMFKGDSPQKCEWAGSLFILAAIVLCVIVAILALICYAVYLLITLL